MEIGNLWVRLGLGSDEFRKGIKESERDAQTFGKTLTGVFKTATSSVQASLRSLGQIRLKDVMQMPEFKETIGELRDLQLEYALTSSKMKNTATDTEKLEAQLEYLNSALAAHQKGMSAVRQAYNKAAAEKGKDSAEAKKLETQLKRLELAESNLKNNIHDTETALKKQTEAVNKSEGGFKNLSNQLDKFQNKTNTVSTAIKGLIAGITIKGAWNWLVSGNAQMEQYRQTLNVVMKDTQKAGEILEWATKFAAQTPFELPEIIEATTRLQAYGIEAQKVLGDIGDMAAAMGKPLTQAMEAVADAQTGELERLKEFGITKQMLIAQATEMGKGEIVNAQGQITNMQAMNDALIAIIRERYNGAMKAQSTTLNGMISNLKDWLGSAGRILGENIFENVKTQLDDLLVSVEQLSDNGQLEAWGKKIGSVFTGLVNVLKWTKDHADILVPVLGGLVASFVAMKIVGIAATLMNTYKNSVLVTTIAQQGLNAAMRANPIGMVITLIGLLVTAVIALYRAWVSNWGGIQTKTQAVASAIVAVANRMVISIATGFNKLKRAVFSLLEGILNAVAPVVGLIGKIAPGFEAGFAKAQAAVSNKIDDIDLQLQELGISALEASGKLSAALSDVRATFNPEWGDLKRLDASYLDNADILVGADTGAAIESVEGLGESLENLGQSAEKAGGKASKAADDTRAAWEVAADRLGIGLQILQAEYDIAAAKMGDNAAETDKLTLKHAHLTSQLEIQKQVVAAVNEGYEQSVAAKGATSEEAKKLELRLAQEKKAQAELEKEVRDTNDAIEEQGQRLKELVGEVQDVASKYRNDLAKALEDYQKKVAEVNKKLADDEEKLMQDYRKSVESRAKSLMDWVGLFDAIPEPKQVTGQDLLGNLQGQVAAFRDWQANLQALTVRGIDQGLISELEQMGPKASSELAALNTLTDDELQQYVLLWQEKSSLATRQATSELEGLRTETQAKIAELRANATAQLAEYAKEWEDKNREIRENTVKELEKLVEEAQKLGAQFASALTEAIATALPGLAGVFTPPETGQADEAAEQRKGVIGEAKTQAAQHAAIVQNEVSTLLQSWTDASNQLSAKQNEIKTQSITTWQEIQQKLSALWQKINADLTKGWTDNRNFIYDILGQVDARFKATEGAATHWGRNLMSNFISGIQSMQDRLTETLLSVSMEVKSYLGFHSPTKKGPGREADTWAPNLVTMYARGLNSGIPIFRGVVSALATEMAKLAGIEPVVSVKTESPKLPTLPKPEAIEYKAKTDIERAESITQEVETRAMAVEIATPTVDTPTISPEVELKSAEIEVLTPEAIAPQVEQPEIPMPVQDMVEIVPFVQQPDAIVPQVNTPKIPVETPAPIVPQVKQPEAVTPMVEQPEAIVPNVKQPDAITPQVKQPDVIVPQVNTPKIPVETPAPIVPQVKQPEAVTIDTETQQVALEVLTPTVDTPEIVPDIELKSAALEVSTGSLQDDIATILKSAAMLFVKTVGNINFSAAINNSGGQSALSTGLTELMDGIKSKASKLSASSGELLNRLKTPAVNVNTGTPVPVAGGGGVIINGDLYLYGSNAEEIWEQLERKLYRLGVRW